ncbi:MAG: hypothetical protein GYB65_24080 [Chloroflexi bacterium]|nr:hypothetical protein [Chloroflexota bacterium]
MLPPTITPGILPVRTATPLLPTDGTTARMSSIALYLNVSGAACYETAVGSLVCLGQVHNPLDVPVEQVTVGVQLVNAEGVVLADQQALVFRWIIPPNAAAPYRVLFERVPPGYAGAYVYVGTGEVAHDVDLRYAVLTAQPVSGTFMIDEYQVTLSVLNEGTTVAQHLAATMTLLNENGQVTGFARIQPDQGVHLAPGEALALSIKVIPQAQGTVAFDAFVEGQVTAVVDP